MKPFKIIFPEKDIPRQWYNLAADLPHSPLPPVGPDGKPITPDQLATVFDEAVKAREEGKEKGILFNYSGHGFMDLACYEEFFSGKLESYTLPESELKKSTASVKNFPKAEIRKSGRW